MIHILKILKVLKYLKGLETLDSDIILVHITQRFMESGNPLIIESTFSNKSGYRNMNEGNVLQLAGKEGITSII